MNLDKYKALLFDCDGVVLNSNAIKSNAFYEAALPLGKEVAQAFLEYHVQNGGVSRYRKFEYLCDVIVPKYQHVEKVRLSTEVLLDRYVKNIQKGMLNCDIAPGLQQLRARMPDAMWCIVSGGDQTELRSVFKTRQIDSMFNGGIFGSPDTKFEIVERELKDANIKRPALFLGDSQLDHQVASAFSMDFVFLSGWTECPDWADYCRSNSLKTISSVYCLLEGFTSK